MCLAAWKCSARCCLLLARRQLASEARVAHGAGSALAVKVTIVVAVDMVEIAKIAVAVKAVRERVAVETVTLQRVKVCVMVARVRVMAVAVKCTRLLREHTSTPRIDAATRHIFDCPRPPGHPCIRVARRADQSNNRHSGLAAQC